MKNGADIKELRLLNEVTQIVGDIIHEYISLVTLGCNEIDLLNLCDEVIHEGVLDDLYRFAESDPAAKNDSKYVLSAYKGFLAMIYYRVAHAILMWDICKEANEEIQQYLRSIAKIISEEGKVKTGIDIHPAAQIAPGCVIDHGVGTKISGSDFYEGKTTVIGETAIIGRNCTILNDVVIGASSVNKGQKRGRRQPKIGDNVTICAGARLYGKIEVGDNVWIGSKCIIYQDIPSNTKIIMENQYQICKSNNSIFEFDGLIKENEGTYILGGRGIEETRLQIIDEKYNEINAYEVIVISREENFLRFRIKKLKDATPKKVMLKIITKDDQWYYYFSRLLVRELLSKEA